MKSLLSFALFAVLGTVLASQALAVPYTIPDAELLNTDAFSREWGGGSLISRSALPGEGVSYVMLLGSTGDGKTAYGDDYRVAATANFDWDFGLGHFSSLAAYDSILLTVRYVSGPAGSNIDMHLFMNTGFTGESGFPSWDSRNNTFWGGAWSTIALGEMGMIQLDFDSAQPKPSELLDNPEPHTQAPDGFQSGDYVEINMRDRNEVSHFGFEVADFNLDLARGEQIIIELNVVPEPAGIAILLLGLTALVRRRH